jgi:hypothetical protein
MRFISDAIFSFKMTSPALETTIKSVYRILSLFQDVFCARMLSGDGERKGCAFSPLAFNFDVAPQIS